MVDPHHLPRLVFSSPVHFLSFGFGAGLSPRAPGTAGTLIAIPVYLLLAGLPPLIYVALCALMFVAGIWLCGRTARALGVHDHSGIVWDEIVGYLLTMVFAPAGWIWVTSGFFLFRFFDIIKPWPIGLMDRRVPGGLGIMLDDAVAAVYAGAILALSAFWAGA